MRQIMRRSAFMISFVISAFVIMPKSWADSDYRMIDTARLHAMVVDNAYALEGGRRRPFTIVDARDGEEYARSHIASAISIPEGDFERSKDLLRGDQNVPLVVYCNDVKSGECRRWADKAKAAGFANIAIYSEGLSAWKEKDLPVVPLAGNSK